MAVADPQPRAADAAPTIRRIWRELLDHSGFADDDDFFDVGGTSLLATRLVAALRTALRREFALADVFEHPTVALLASRAAKLPDVIVPDASLEAQVSDSQREQLEVVVASSARGRPIPPHNVQILRRLVGPLDVAALDDALRATVERQPALRTTFTLTPPRARVGARDPDWGLEVTDVSGSPSPREAALADHDRRLERPFPVEGPHLLDAKLYVLGEGEYLFSCVVDHLISDGGASLAILWGDVAEHYRARVEGDDPRLPPIAASAQQLVALRDAEMLRQLDARLAEWDEALAGYELPPRFDVAREPYDPASFAPPAPAVLRAAHVDSGGGRSWSERCRQVGVSGYAAALAVLSRGLGAVGGVHDLVVVTSVEGRQRAEAEHLVGWFAHLLMVRCRTLAKRSAETAEAIERELLAAHRRAVPYHLLLEHFVGPHDVLAPPVPWVQVSYAPPSEPPAALGPVEVEDVDHEPDTTTVHGISFDVRADGHGVAVRAEAPAARYSEEEVEGVVDAVAAEIRAFLEG